MKKNEKVLETTEQVKTLLKERLLKETLPLILIVAMVCIVIRIFFFTVTLTHGSSMEPTLHSGDMLGVLKCAYWFDEPEREDIVVTYDPDGTLVVKRVGGIPGDTITKQDGSIYTLKEDEYLIFGDNKDNSYDSKYYGPITKDMIKGKVIRYWPRG